MAVRDGKRGEFVAEVLHREIEALSQADGVREGLRAIGKKLPHLAGAFEITLGIGRQQKAGGIHIRVVAEAVEHVEQRTFGFGGVKHAVRRQQRQMGGFRELNQRADPLFGPQAMALEFDEYIVWAKEAAQFVNDLDWFWRGVSPHFFPPAIPEKMQD